MQAVILAGGAGTRLYPLTLSIPKAMVKVSGKPFVGHIIEKLKRYGIKDLVFCIGFLADQFKEYFGDGSRHGAKISYSVENEFMGTGGALKLAEKFLEKDFFVINGDTYLPIDYSSVYKAFKSSNKNGLLVLYDNKKKIARPNIAVNGKGLVTGYVKKEKIKKGNKEIILKKAPKHRCRYIDAGVGIFEKKVLKMIPKGRFVSLETEIFPKLIKRRELASVVVSKPFYDIGTPQRLKLAKNAFK